MMGAAGAQIGTLARSCKEFGGSALPAAISSTNPATRAIAVVVVRMSAERDLGAGRGLFVGALL